MEASLNCWSITEYFSELTDPRIERRKLHALTDIVVIAMCAVMAGAEGWEEMWRWAQTKEAWLKTFLELKNGIPCPDTFARIFQRLMPEEFEDCFNRWVRSLAKLSDKEVVAIDGKTARGSFDSANKQSPLHMITAFATQQGLVLGRVCVDGKSNEITAIPELLRIIDITGTVVTIDAMGCQRDIARAIIDGGADYTLVLKANQEGFHEDVSEFFTEHQKDNFAELDHDYHETTDAEHGRLEVRKYWVTSDVAWTGRDVDWKNLQSIGMVEATRTVNGKTSTERRLFISSLPADAKLFAHSVRSHWGIENSQHWILDVVFREDASRIRRDYAPANMAMLRRIALNLLKADKTCSYKSLKGRLKRAAWDHDYILRVLHAQQNPLH